MWQKERVYVLWLGAALLFLLVWPTKWPQYILVLTAPLGLAAAEGVRALVVEPVKGAWARRKERRIRVRVLRITEWQIRVGRGPDSHQRPPRAAWARS